MKCEKCKTVLEPGRSQPSGHQCLYEKGAYRVEEDGTKVSVIHTDERCRDVLAVRLQKVEQALKAAASLLEDDYVHIIGLMAGRDEMPEKWQHGGWFVEPLPRLNAWREQMRVLFPEENDNGRKE